MGWTIGIATDGNKTSAVQVNPTAGGHILFPGSGATVSWASVASANYELLVLQYDGGSFRVLEATPRQPSYWGSAAAHQVSTAGAFRPSAPIWLRRATAETRCRATTHGASDDCDRRWLDDGLCHRQ